MTSVQAATSVSVPETEKKAWHKMKTAEGSTSAGHKVTDDTELLKQREALKVKVKELEETNRKLAEENQALQQLTARFKPDATTPSQPARYPTPKDMQAFLAELDPVVTAVKELHKNIGSLHEDVRIVYNNVSTKDPKEIRDAIDSNFKDSFQRLSDEYVKLAIKQNSAKFENIIKEATRKPVSNDDLETLSSQNTTPKEYYLTNVKTYEELREQCVKQKKTFDLVVKEANDRFTKAAHKINYLQTCAEGTGWLSKSTIIAVWPPKEAPVAV